MIDIDVNSWHYKMNHKMYKDSTEEMRYNGTSLCSYMTLTFASILKIIAITITISFLVFMAVSLVMLLGVAVYMAFYNIIGQNLEAFVRYNEYILSLHRVVIGILAIILSLVIIAIGYLITKLIINYNRYKREKLALSNYKKPVQPNMFMEYLRNKRDRICIQVKFTNKDQSK